jgi:hypothetical protein
VQPSFLIYSLQFISNLQYFARIEKWFIQTRASKCLSRPIRHMPPIPLIPFVLLKLRKNKILIARTIILIEPISNPDDYNLKYDYKFDQLKKLIQKQDFLSLIKI